jgi:DHA2 family multidrug resistance protein
MNVLDSSIANVSLPAISGDLGVSPNQGVWVITSFAVANAISVPLTGWLTQRIGMVRLFTSSVLLFTLASWLCGLAPSIELLILFRVIQGAVAGPMIPLSQTLLLQSYPKAKAGMALAVWSMTVLVAPVMGPLLGGWITDNISWPWIFYINVPVGLFAAGLTWSIYRDRESATRKLPIDVVGLSLLVIWVGALQIMLDKGRELDWFHSGEIVTLAVVSAIGFVVFIVWELTDEHPVVDLTLFRRRNFWTGTLSMSVGYGLFFGNVVILPLWLQLYIGYTATDAGWSAGAGRRARDLCMPFVGKRLDRRYALALDDLVRHLRAGDVDAKLVQHRRRHRTIVPTVIRASRPRSSSSARRADPVELEPDRIPAATGLSNFVRITAGAIGTSVMPRCGTAYRAAPRAVDRARIGVAAGLADARAGVQYRADRGLHEPTH